MRSQKAALGPPCSGRFKLFWKCRTRKDSSWSPQCIIADRNLRRDVWRAEEAQCNDFFRHNGECVLRAACVARCALCAVCEHWRACKFALLQRLCEPLGARRYFQRAAERVQSYIDMLFKITYNIYVSFTHVEYKDMWCKCTSWHIHIGDQNWSSHWFSNKQHYLSLTHTHVI